MDDEKVIKGLEHCTSNERDSDKFGGIGKCRGCPYYGYDCVNRLKSDALSLIKEPKIESLENAMGIIEEWFDRSTHILPCESVCEAYKYICKKAIENEKRIVEKISSLEIEE